MTERTRSEELFDLLSDTLNELSELESRGKKHVMNKI